MLPTVKEYINIVFWNAIECCTLARWPSISGRRLPGSGTLCRRTSCRRRIRKRFKTSLFGRSFFQTRV